VISDSLELVKNFVKSCIIFSLYWLEWRLRSTISLNSLVFIFALLVLKIGLSSLGYSVHVEIAVIGRLGKLLAYPIISFLIDRGSGSYMIIICLMTYAFSFLMNFLFIPMLSKGKHVEKVFYFIVRKTN
jgi:hypothetical protein